MVVMTEQDDLKLVRRCLEGETKAFEGLINRYQKPLFNVALRMLGDYEDAEDVTQTVFVKAFEKLDSFKPEHKFFSWIYRMMVNESLNTISRRRLGREPDDNLLSTGKNPEEAYYDSRASERIQLAIMDLQIDHRVVIVLRHFGDLPYRDISFILELPEKTVKSRLFTARKLLCVTLAQRGISAHD